MEQWKCMGLIKDFNPRSREGSDQGTDQPGSDYHISIHAPAKGATRRPFPSSSLQHKISIHAPAKGATIQNVHHRRGKQISIHAPAKGATSRGEVVADTLQYFNPRSREGSDLTITTFIPSLYLFQSTLPRRERHRNSVQRQCRYDISIHAPAKGATRTGRSYITYSNHFNPRSREGSDDDMTVSLAGGYAFQSTLPRRERPAHAALFTYQRTFQSTLPRRERRRQIHMTKPHGTFQSTLPRRERRKADRETMVPIKFQSTLPRRERREQVAEKKGYTLISIHAPAKGATAFINIFSLAVRLFFISSHQ